MEHTGALDDHLGILEHQVAVSEHPEVRLSPEDDRHDVDRHVVDEPQRQRLSSASSEVTTERPATFFVTTSTSAVARSETGSPSFGHPRGGGVGGDGGSRRGQPAAAPVSTAH